MNSTSESLLFRLQSRDETSPDQSAWEQFVSLYTPLIYYWARKTGMTQADASDLSQEVLTIVFQKLPEFRYDKTKSFRGWLRTVTLNKYRESRRKKSSQMSPATGSMLEQLAPIELAQSTWDIDYARLLVAQAMEPMKSDFQEGVWQALRKVISDGLSVEQAAKQTGVNQWTIYSAKSRLMKRLRNELDGLL